MNYDVIVVGAGSAGCVLAARLSEDLGRKVLLLEAGPDYQNAADLPAEIASGLRPAFTHDWDYHSQPNGLGRSIHLPRAKLVGGCSATNATIALRGAPSDYDDWAKRGNPGWSFAEVLPFFQRLENEADFDNQWHGRGGPVPIRRYPARDLTPTQAAFLETCVALGYPPVDDYNAPGALGAGRLPTNTVNGVRQSAALTYLAPARGRPNLTVRGGALVDRVLLRGRRAVGLSLAEPAETLLADRVILAAGAYGSPAILMRSGLGPARDLEALGIPVAEDLPGVGRNLIDHPLLGLRFSARQSARSEPVPGFQTLLTLRSSPAAEGPDLQIFPMSASTWEPVDATSGAEFNIFVSVMRPDSRGRLCLRSRDPAAAPRIELGLLSDPADLARMVGAVCAARRLARTPPLSNLVIEELFPGARVSDEATDLEGAIRAEVEVYHHPVGTCRMGPAGDSGAVVNVRGDVHGVERLSVVDASIMPTIPSANTNLPTLMLAERCAAWLVDRGRAAERASREAPFD